MSCRALTFLAAVVSMLVSEGSATAMGAVKLDNYTFDKMITTPGLTWLVKVDKSYAYGDKEDAFKELCKLAFPVKDFLLGEIPVQEYGDKENSDLQEKFGVKTDDFPAYFLLKGSFESRVKFEGFADPRAQKPSTWDEDEDGKWEAPMLADITTENLNLWLRRNGIKMPSIGTIQELDEIVKTFLKDGRKDSDLDAAKKLAEGEFKNDKKAPIYVKTMQKIKEKGTDYVQTELTRVRKILAGKLTPEKAAELNEKIKILNVFADTQ
jgi:endoplasmic reticulum protein 29